MKLKAVKVIVIMIQMKIIKVKIQNYLMKLEINLEINLILLNRI